MNQKITDCKGDKTMEQKLLFFDIDGTLITEETGEIPERTSAFCQYRQDQDKPSPKGDQLGFSWVCMRLRNKYFSGRPGTAFGEAEQ